MVENTWYSIGVMIGRPQTRKASEFGKRVAEARKGRGLTQRQLAELLGVSQKMVDYYERRASNVTADVVCKLSYALGISADELLGIERKRTKPGPKSKLQRRIEQLEQLPPSKQRVIVQVLDMALGTEAG